MASEGQREEAGVDLGGTEDHFKTSFCSIADKGERIEEMIPVIARLGYDGIEIWGPHLEDYLDRGHKLSHLHALLEEEGLEAPMVSPYFNFTENVEEREDSIASAERFVDYAETLDAPLVRAFVSHLGSEEAQPRHWRLAVESLKEIAGLGAKQGVGFALEIHSGQLMDTTSTSLQLVRRVAEENVGLNLDIYNLYERGEDPLTALDRLYPHVVHVHAKNGKAGSGENSLGQFLAEGDMDYRPFLRELRERKFGGFVSVEYFGPADWAEAARRELKYLDRFT